MSEQKNISELNINIKQTLDNFLDDEKEEEKIQEEYKRVISKLCEIKLSIDEMRIFIDFFKQLVRIEAEIPVWQSKLDEESKKSLLFYSATTVNSLEQKILQLKNKHRKILSVLHDFLNIIHLNETLSLDLLNRLINTFLNMTKGSDLVKNLGLNLIEAVCGNPNFELTKDHIKELKLVLIGNSVPKENSIGVLINILSDVLNNEEFIKFWKEAMIAMITLSPKTDTTIDETNFKEKVIFCSALNQCNANVFKIFLQVLKNNFVLQKEQEDNIKIESASQQISKNSKLLILTLKLMAERLLQEEKLQQFIRMMGENFLVEENNNIREISFEIFKILIQENRAIANTKLQSKLLWATLVDTVVKIVGQISTKKFGYDLLKMLCESNRLIEFTPEHIKLLQEKLVEDNLESKEDNIVTAIKILNGLLNIPARLHQRAILFVIMLTSSMSVKMVGLVEVMIYLFKSDAFSESGFMAENMPRIIQGMSYETAKNLIQVVGSPLHEDDAEVGKAKIQLLKYIYRHRDYVENKSEMGNIIGKILRNALTHKCIEIQKAAALAIIELTDNFLVFSKRIIDRYDNNDCSVLTNFLQKSVDLELSEKQISKFIQIAEETFTFEYKNGSGFGLDLLKGLCQRKDLQLTENHVEQIANIFSFILDKFSSMLVTGLKEKRVNLNDCKDTVLMMIALYPVDGGIYTYNRTLQTLLNIDINVAKILTRVLVAKSKDSEKYRVGKSLLLDIANQFSNDQKKIAEFIRAVGGDLADEKDESIRAIRLEILKEVFSKNIALDKNNIKLLSDVLIAALKDSYEDVQKTAIIAMINLNFQKSLDSSLDPVCLGEELANYIVEMKAFDVWMDLLLRQNLPTFSNKIVLTTMKILADRLYSEEDIALLIHTLEIGLHDGIMDASLLESVLLKLIRNEKLSEKNRKILLKSCENWIETYSDVLIDGDLTEILGASIVLLKQLQKEEDSIEEFDVPLSISKIIKSALSSNNERKYRSLITELSTRRLFKENVEEMTKCIKSLDEVDNEIKKMELKKIPSLLQIKKIDTNLIDKDIERLRDQQKQYERMAFDFPRIIKLNPHLPDDSEVMSFLIKEAVGNINKSNNIGYEILEALCGNLKLIFQKEHIAILKKNFDLGIKNRTYAAIIGEVNAAIIGELLKVELNKNTVFAIVRLIRSQNFSLEAVIYSILKHDMGMVKIWDLSTDNHVKLVVHKLLKAIAKTALEKNQIKNFIRAVGADLANEKNNISRLAKILILAELIGNKNLDDKNSALLINIFCSVLKDELKEIREVAGASLIKLIAIDSNLKHMCKLIDKDSELVTKFIAVLKEKDKTLSDESVQNILQRIMVENFSDKRIIESFIKSVGSDVDQNVLKIVSDVTIGMEMISLIENNDDLKLSDERITLLIQICFENIDSDDIENQELGYDVLEALCQNRKLKFNEEHLKIFDERFKGLVPDDNVYIQKVLYNMERRDESVIFAIIQVMRLSGEFSSENILISIFEKNVSVVSKLISDKNNDVKLLRFVVEQIGSIARKMEDQTQIKALIEVTGFDFSYVKDKILLEFKLIIFKGLSQNIAMNDENKERLLRTLCSRTEYTEDAMTIISSPNWDPNLICQLLNKNPALIKKVIPALEKHSENPKSEWAISSFKKGYPNFVAKEIYINNLPSIKKIFEILAHHLSDKTAIGFFIQNSSSPKVWLELVLHNQNLTGEHITILINQCFEKIEMKNETERQSSYDVLEALCRNPKLNFNEEHLAIFKKKLKIGKLLEVSINTATIFMIISNSRLLPIQNEKELDMIDRISLLPSYLNIFLDLQNQMPRGNKVGDKFIIDLDNEKIQKFYSRLTFQEQKLAFNLLSYYLPYFTFMYQGKDVSSKIPVQKVRSNPYLTFMNSVKDKSAEEQRAKLIQFNK